MKINRTVGKRTTRELGRLQPPTSATRAWVRRMIKQRTRVPKGVFRYTTMTEANADWEKWNAEMVAQTVQENAIVRLRRKHEDEGQ